MHEPLLSVLRTAANVMASSQKGRLACFGPSANYGELMFSETIEGVSDFIQQEIGRLSLATSRAILVTKTGFEYEGTTLVFKVELVDRPDEPFGLYALYVPSMGQGAAPGLEIEFLT